MGLSVSTHGRSSSNDVIENLSSRIEALEERNKNLISYIEYIGVSVNTLAKNLNNISGTIRITKSGDVYFDDNLMKNAIYLKKLLDQVGEIEKVEVEKLKSLSDFNL